MIDDPLDAHRQLRRRIDENPELVARGIHPHVAESAARLLFRQLGTGAQRRLYEPDRMIQELVGAIYVCAERGPPGECVGDDVIRHAIEPDALPDGRCVSREEPRLARLILPPLPAGEIDTPLVRRHRIYRQRTVRQNVLAEVEVLARPFEQDCSSCENSISTTHRLRDISDERPTRPLGFNGSGNRKNSSRERPSNPARTMCIHHEPLRERCAIKCMNADCFPLSVPLPTSNPGDQEPGVVRTFCTDCTICTLSLDSPSMTRLPTTEARIRFADVVNDVAFRGERVVLQRHGKDIAA